MNVDTGELRMAAELRAALDEVSAGSATKDGWVEIPPALNRAARRQMASGRRVNLAGKSGLAAFARGVRTAR